MKAKGSYGAKEILYIMRYLLIIIIIIIIVKWIIIILDLRSIIQRDLSSVLDDSGRIIDVIGSLNSIL